MKAIELLQEFRNEVKLRPRLVEGVRRWKLSEIDEAIAELEQMRELVKTVSKSLNAHCELCGGLKDNCATCGYPLLLTNTNKALDLMGGEKNGLD